MKVTVTCRFADQVGAERAAGRLRSMGCSEGEITMKRSCGRETQPPKRISYPTLAGGAIGAIIGGGILALPTMGIDGGATAIFGALVGGSTGAFFGKLFDIEHPYESPFRPGNGETTITVCADSERIARLCALLVEYGGRTEEPIGAWMAPQRTGSPPLN